MKAIILAAGYGKRMRPISFHTPKALLTVNNQPMIARHIEQLASCGIDAVIVNCSWLGQRIIDYIASKSWPIPIQIVVEDHPLETAGGIRNAAAQLFTQSAQAVVVNVDIWHDFDVRILMRQHTVAHLATIVGYQDARRADFQIDDLQQIEFSANSSAGYIYTGISLVQQQLFSLNSSVYLADCFHHAATNNTLGMVEHTGKWFDIGTPTSWAAAKKNI